MQSRRRGLEAEGRGPSKSRSELGQARAREPRGRNGDVQGGGGDAAGGACETGACDGASERGARCPCRPE